MDAGTPGVMPPNGDGAKRAAEIEGEIQSIRENIDGLMSEFNHRRQRLNPLRVMREHPTLVLVIGGSALAGLVTAGALLLRSRAHKRRSWIERGRRLSSALGHLMDGEPVESSPGIGWKILTAAGTATAAFAGRRLARRLFTRDQLP